MEIYCDLDTVFKDKIVSTFSPFLSIDLGIQQGPSIKIEISPNYLHTFRI